MSGVDPLSSAESHVDLGLPGSASAFRRRVVERFTRFFVDPQRAYNRGVIDAIRLLREDNERLELRITLLGDDIERLTAALRTDLTQVQLALSDGQTDGALTRGQVVDLAKSLQRLERALDGLRPGQPARPVEG